MLFTPGEIAQSHGVAPLALGYVLLGFQPVPRANTAIVNRAVACGAKPSLFVRADAAILNRAVAYGLYFPFAFRAMPS